MPENHESPASLHRRRLADLRRVGYRGPAYLRGRPAYEYPIGRRVGSTG
jgi:hypothetical protein